MLKKPVSARAGFAALCALALSSSPVLAADLVEVYGIAQENDADLKAAFYQLEASREALPQSKAGLRPNVGLNAAINESDADSYNRNTIAISLTQPLYRKQNLAAVDQAEAAIAQAEAEYAAAEQALMLNVAELYFNVLAAMDNLEFAIAELEAIERQLDQAQKRFEVGLIAITDVREAQAQYDLAQASRILAENQLANARNALQVVTGDFLSGFAILGDSLVLTPPEPTDMEAWVKTAEAENPALVAARQAAEVARQAVVSARGGYHPTLDLVASYQRNDATGPGVRDGDASTLSLQLNVPIYTGGLTRSQVNQAMASFQAAQSLYDRQRRAVAQLTRDAYLGVVAGISRVRALEQALTSTRTAAEATQAGFEVGTRTAVDVLLALRDTYASQRDYARARYDYLLNALRLKQAVGTLSLQDMESVNRWLR